MTSFFSPSIPFYTGIPLRSPFPLARFLPPYYRGAVEAYANEHLISKISRQSYILDPFGASPLLPIELANSGAAVVVCCNNPILSILIHLAATRPLENEYQSILAEISALKKLDARLEKFLRSLYLSICDLCYTEIEVEAFVWERNNTGKSHQLVSKLYRCPHCGNEGLFPVTIQDRQRLQRLPPRSLLEAQAASRIVDTKDPTYPAVVESLGIYPTRSLYAIISLLNKLDEVAFADRQKIILKGLLCVSFDLVNALWSHPPRRSRPKQLSIPSQFYEYNFWNCLEEAKDIWVKSTAESTFYSIMVHDYPRLPRPGEISIFHGRLKELLSHTAQKEFSAIVTTVPRPNQAFWTLCAIWSGWLEGREGVKPLKPALHRKRYDWGWHCRALEATFRQLSMHSLDPTPCFGFMEEYEANFLAAALFAADHASLRLENLTLRSDQQRAQILWRTSRPPTQPKTILKKEINEPPPQLQNHIRNAVQNYLEQTLEPLSLPIIHAVALANVVETLDNTESEALLQNRLLKFFPFGEISDYPNFFLTFLENLIKSTSSLSPIGEEEKSFETTLWWLTQPTYDHLPLVDRVENFIYEYLLEQKNESFSQIDQFICRQIISIGAPLLSLIRECLQSYASHDEKTNRWTIREEEFPLYRERDIAEIRQHIITIGHQLGYQVQDGQPMLWVDQTQNQRTIWHICTQAQIGNLLKASLSKEEQVVVIPGSRVNLLLYKIQLYPFLQNYIGEQIRVIRFRQIRWMTTQPLTNRRMFKEWLAIDPIRYQTSQLSLW